MAYCKKCKKEIEPELHGNKYLCPDCHKFVKVEDDERAEPQVTVLEPPEKETKSKKKEPEMIQEGKTKLIVAPKTIKYDAADLHMGEILINLGFAKDLNDLARKNMKLSFSLLNMGALGKQVNAMELNESKEPNPERTMKEIQQQEMMKAYIEGMRKGNQPDPMQMMMMIRQMENLDKGKSSGDNNFMDKMMQLQMMQAMTKPQTDVSLQKEIADLKHQMQMQQMMNQQAQMQQGSNSSQQFMQQMEAIRSERDKSIKEAEILAQQERDKNLQLAFDNRRIELESRLQSMEKELKEKGSGQLATQRIVQMKEEIKAIKEMSHELGDREKSTGEVLSETIGNVAEKAIPAFQTLIEQKQQQKMMQPMPPEIPPEPANPVTESGIPVDIQPSDMTPTEQQMADQMSSMYLTPRNKLVKK